MKDYQPPLIGKSIQYQRNKKKMSLDTLSKRSGVSKSMLSQIEQDKTNPTVIIVWKIARALNLTVQELMESCPRNNIEVIRFNDAPVIYSDDSLCEIRINSPIHMSDNLELYHYSMKPGGKNTSMPHYADTEEFLTVIEGKVKVFSGDTSVILCKGDTGRYKADVTHSIENIHDGISEIYLVVCFKTE